MSAHIESPIPRRKVIVAGMGPGGLVAAIEAHRRGYNVTIYENRDYFTRSQRVVLDPNLILPYLKSLADYNDDKDSDFLDALESNSNTIEIGLLQDFLERKLKGIKICKGSQYEIEGFDFSNPQKNFLKVKANGKLENVEFDHFISADGASRTMAKFINRDLGSSRPDKTITHVKMDVQTRQTPHGCVTLRPKLIKDTDGFDTPVAIARNITIGNGVNHITLTFQDALKLKSLGWDQPFPPKCYLIHNPATNTFFVSGEIPQKILELGVDPKTRALQAQKLEEWAKMILQLSVLQNADALELDLVSLKGPDNEALPARELERATKLNQMKATAFEVVLTNAVTPCTELNNKGYFTLIGDAAMSPNFHHGHGAGDSMSDGFTAAYCLPVIPGASQANLPSANLPFLENIKKMEESRNSDPNIFNRSLFEKQREAKKDKLQNAMATLLASAKSTYENTYTPAANDELVRQSRQLVLIANQLGNDPDVNQAKEAFLALIAPLSKIIDNEKEALKLFGKQKAEDLKELEKKNVELVNLQKKQEEHIKTVEKAIEDHNKSTDQNRYNTDPDYQKARDSIRDGIQMSGMTTHMTLGSDIDEMTKKLSAEKSAIENRKFQREKIKIIPNLDDIYSKGLVLAEKISNALDKQAAPQIASMQTELEAIKKEKIALLKTQAEENKKNQELLFNNFTGFINSMLGYMVTRSLYFAKERIRLESREKALVTALEKEKVLSEKTKAVLKEPIETLQSHIKKLGVINTKKDMEGMVNYSQQLVQLADPLKNNANVKETMAELQALLVLVRPLMTAQNLENPPSKLIALLDKVYEKSLLLADTIAATPESQALKIKTNLKEPQVMLYGYLKRIHAQKEPKREEGEVQKPVRPH